MSTDRARSFLVHSRFEPDSQSQPRSTRENPGELEVKSDFSLSADPP
jgi:hypothetical protein